MESASEVPAERILARIRWHESAAEMFEQYGHSNMAAWSREVAADWRKILEARRGGQHD
jgi:hypothetical protein